MGGLVYPILLVKTVWQTVSTDIVSSSKAVLIDLGSTESIETLPSFGRT